MNAAELLSLARLRAWTWAWERGISRRDAGLGGAFSVNAKRKLLLVSVPGAISQSQIYPFYFWQRELRERWGYEIREVGLETFIAAPDKAPADADLVCFQAWIDKTPEQLRAVLTQLRSRNPRARVAFLDGCAPTDLRFGAWIGNSVDCYVKKHVLRDRSAYARSTLGDTNLTDWYGRHYGQQLPPTHFSLPEGFMDKLLVGPSFVTAPYMLPRFLAVGNPPSAAGRAYDLHSRLGGAGSTSWYEKMRTDAQLRVRELKGVKVTPQTFVNKRAYMRELRSSRMCFSPFGYGEVCWRDYEAVFSGALLLKPDMSHLETIPDVFVAHETYVPLRWDFGDLADVVAMYMADEAKRLRIVEQAYEAMHAYANSNRFVDLLEPLFAP